MQYSLVAPIPIFIVLHLHGGKMFLSMTKHKTAQTLNALAMELLQYCTKPSSINQQC